MEITMGYRIDTMLLYNVFNHPGQLFASLEEHGLAFDSNGNLVDVTELRHDELRLEFFHFYGDRLGGDENDEELTEEEVSEEEIQDLSIKTGEQRKEKLAQYDMENELSAEELIQQHYESNKASKKGVMAVRLTVPPSGEGAASLKISFHSAFIEGKENKVVKKLKKPFSKEVRKTAEASVKAKKIRIKSSKKNKK